MSMHIDALADLIRGAVLDGDATREDFERALEQVFPSERLDPFEGTGTEEYLVGWTIDQEAGSAAEAAREVWHQVFNRGHRQPSADSACVFVVSDGDREVQIDLSDERFAHLFDD